MKDTITKALAQFDPSDPDQWTDDGLPRIEIVQELSGLKSVSRKAITSAAPAFSRDNPELEGRESPESEAEAPSLKSLQADLDRAQKRLQEAEAQAAKVKTEVHQAQREMDVLIEARDRARPVHENQLEIMRYIDTQSRLRTERANETAAAPPPRRQPLPTHLPIRR